MYRYDDNNLQSFSSRCRRSLRIVRVSRTNEEEEEKEEGRIEVEEEEEKALERKDRNVESNCVRV